jgi:carnitine O-palmitoyltransferase 1
VCPGGGFGPVSDQGYGVSYMVPGDSRIFFHISSKRSCKKTDSQTFARCLFDAMAEMRALFTGKKQPAAAIAGPSKTATANGK